MTLAIPPNAPPKRYTPEDLLRLPDSVNYELVGGKLVERNMGMRSSGVAAEVLGAITYFLRSHRIGRVLGADASYRCFPDDPDRVRKPDVTFIRFGRLPGDQLPEGHCPIPPDLAVEVVSPNDLAYEVDEKVAEYLAAGVPLVWVIFPRTRVVNVRRPPSSPLGSASALSGADLISGEDVLPGFSCPVSEFFR